MGSSDTVSHCLPCPNFSQRNPQQSPQPVRPIKISALAADATYIFMLALRWSLGFCESQATATLCIKVIDCFLA